MILQAASPVNIRGSVLFIQQFHADPTDYRLVFLTRTDVRLKNSHTRDTSRRMFDNDSTKVRIVQFVSIESLLIILLAVSRMTCVQSNRPTHVLC